MIISWSTIRYVMIALPLVITWAGPAAAFPHASKSLSTPSNLVRRNQEGWKSNIFFTDRFQEMYKGRALPEPRSPQEEYDYCIQKWTEPNGSEKDADWCQYYQLQFMVVLATQPSPEDYLAAHEMADRICQETAERKWGRRPHRPLAPHEIEHIRQISISIRQELGQGERREKGGNEGSEPGNNNPLRMQVNPDELRKGARQTFSSVTNNVKDVLRNPSSLGAAMLGGVNQVKKGLAQAPRVMVP